MVQKVLLRFILPLLVFLLTSYVAFWFIKSGEIKKNIVSIIDKNSNIEAESIISSGFPFKNNIEIRGLRIKSSNSFFSGGDIFISSVSAKTDIFSNRFQVTTGNVKVESFDGKSKNIKFNKEPIIDIRLKNQKISKISYKDDGYSILNSEGEVVFKVGDSDTQINFDFSDTSQIITVDSNFRNIDKFDIFNKFDGDLFGDDQSKDQKSEKSLEIVDLDNDGLKNPADIANKVDSRDKDEVVSKNNSGQIKSENVTKNKKEELPDSLPSLAVKEKEEDANKEFKISTDRNLSVSLKLESEFDQSSKSMLLKQVVINNIDISSPIFSINITGILPSLRSGADTSDLKVRVKNLNNILIYLKRWISFIDESVDGSLSAASDTVNDVDISGDNSSEAENAESKDKQENDSNKALSKTEAEEYFDDFDIISIEDKMEEFIIDLARKNPNSNDVSSEFHLFGSGFNMVINNVPFMEVLSDFTKIIGPVMAKISIKIKKSKTPATEPDDNINKEDSGDSKVINSDDKVIKEGATDTQKNNVKENIDTKDSNQTQKNKDIKQQDLELENDKSPANKKELKKDIDTSILPNKVKNKDFLNDAKPKKEPGLKDVKTDNVNNSGAESSNLKDSTIDNKANNSKSDSIDNNSINKKVSEDNFGEKNSQNIDSLDSDEIPVSPLDAMKYIENMDQDLDNKESQ
ncbi:hypothetical protein N9O56_00785 [Rickettsiales bacterium]|nr:hypothetical protein [Rickettsiales bacterium]